MKTLILFLLLLPVAVMGQITTNTVPLGVYFYVDSLKTDTSSDTVDVAFTSPNRGGVTFYTITIWTNTGTDTVKVFTKSINDSYWSQKGLVKLSNNSDVTEIIATTTAQEYVIFDPQPKVIRLLTQDSSASTLFVVSAKAGLLTPGAGNGSKFDTLIANQFVPGGPGTATDSVRGKYDAIPYAQNDAKQDSVAKWLVFNIGASRGVVTGVYMTADTANATNNTRKLILVADTSGWGNLALDNAAFTVSPAQAQKIIGEPFVVSLRTFGTGSTSASGGVQSYQWFVTGSSNKLYGLLLMDAAYTGKKRETSTVKLSFEKFE